MIKITVKSDYQVSDLAGLASYTHSSKFMTLNDIGLNRRQKLTYLFKANNQLEVNFNFKVENKKGI